MSLSYAKMKALCLLGALSSECLVVKNRSCNLARESSIVCLAGVETLRDKLPSIVRVWQRGSRKFWGPVGK